MAFKHVMQNVTCILQDFAFQADRFNSYRFTKIHQLWLDSYYCQRHSLKRIIYFPNLWKSQRSKPVPISFLWQIHNFRYV